MALLKLASPAAAAAALGQLRARNGEMRLAVGGPGSQVLGAGGRFSVVQPALPEKLEASNGVNPNANPNPNPHPNHPNPNPHPNPKPEPGGAPRDLPQG